MEMMNSFSKEVNIDYILETDIRKKPYYGQMKFCAYELTVLGDPALSVWTETPKTWTALPTATATGSAAATESTTRSTTGSETGFTKSATTRTGYKTG